MRMRIHRAYAAAPQAVPEGVTGGQVVADVTSTDVVVFLVGMRVNRWRKLRSWGPLFTTMPRLIAELQAGDVGLLSAQIFWSGRTFLVVQYWRSAEELGAYARNPTMGHAAAWRAFNTATAPTGNVGIFHETYVVPREWIESVYGNMAPFGLAKAVGAVARSGRSGTNQAHRRLNTTEPEYVTTD